MRIKNIIINLRRPLIVLIHLCLILVAYIFAFYLRFEFTFLPENWTVILRTLPLLIIIKLLFFYFFGVFGGLWRYISIIDLWNIILANFFSSIAFALSVLFYHTFFGYPQLVFIIDFILCTAFVSGVRFFTRLIRERFKVSLTVKRKNVLIVGAGQAGIAVLRECQNHKIKFAKEYVAKASLLFDLKLILLTIYKMIVKNKVITH